MKIRKIGNAGLIDELHVTIRDKYGNIKKDYTVTKSLWYRIMKKLGIYHNSITYVGMGIVANLTCGVNTSVTFHYMDIGTGSNAANNAQTALQTTLLSDPGRPNIDGANLTIVKTDASSTVNETCQWVWCFSKTNDAELTGTADVVKEVGIFSAATAGSMLLRITWAGDTMNWAAGDTLTLTIKMQVKQGA